jgi:hypothetical protein
MTKIGDKIKISNINATVVHVSSENTVKIIYIDKGNGNWVSNYAILINELWKFENENDYGRKLKDGEYSEFR